MFKDELKKFVEDNPKLVNMRPAGDGIFVLKYKKSVFFNDLWNEYLEECRGTIVDADFNIVSRPFTKVYNYGIEAKAPVLADDTAITAYRKVNGFMVAMTWYNNDVLVSTTGSTDSDFVGYAKEMMLKHMCWADWQMEIKAAEGMTLMFECCHPSDPHIVPEDAGMYFLGCRENTWDSQTKMYGQDMADWARGYALSHLKCGYAEAIQTTVGELKELVKTVRHEGFVFYTADNVSSKIKSPYYLTSKWVARNPRTDKLVDMNNDIKRNLDEEYYPLVDAIRANIVEYTAMDEQARLAWVRNFVS
jgi:RNA ligase